LINESLRRPRFAWEATGTRLAATRAWMQAHFRTPLIRNGYSLVASTGMTSVLGLVYWVLAARLYTVGEIGLNAALISTMMALSAIAQLNLGSILTRFLPGFARSGSQRLILGAYAAGTIAALFSCLLSLWGVHAWAPSLRSLAASPWLAAWFTAATIVWTVFSLQDSVLAGLRRAIWVPIGTTLFALAKIALLILLADSTWRAWGPFASWTLPLLLSVVPVNSLIFGRFLPARDLAAAATRSPMDMRWVARYFAADFLGTLFLMVTIGLAPILVMERVGAEGNAVYYLTWTIAYSLYLVSKSMGISLVAEGAADPWRSKALATGALTHTMGMLFIAVAVVVVAAPLLLQLFGASYASEGGMLLRILCLSALPFGFTSMQLGLARVEGRMATVVLVQAALAFIVLGLGVPLLDLFGALGMGIAWLGAQVAIALALAISAWRRAGWSRAPIRALVTTSTDHGQLNLLRRFRAFLLGRATAGVVREATSRIGDDGSAQRWRCQSILHMNGQLAMLALGPEPDRQTALMKIAHGAEGAVRLRRQGEVLRILQADPALREFRAVLPIVLGEGHAAGSDYVIERPPAGEPGEIMLGDAVRRERALASAAMLITDLHSRTASPRVIDEAWLFDWIDRPIGQINGAAPWMIPSGTVAAAFEAIRRYERAAWSGRVVALGWSHGDFGPASIRFSPDGAHVIGIADWSLARRDAPLALDLCHLALTTRMLVRRQDIGEVVCDLIRDPRWGVSEWPCIADQSPAPAASEVRSLVLLAWLQYIASHRAGSARYVVDCLATAAQLDSILRAGDAGP
jgi:O-antigen/teichoic acid export membrane protein